MGTNATDETSVFTTPFPESRHGTNWAEWAKCENKPKVPPGNGKLIKTIHKLKKMIDLEFVSMFIQFEYSSFLLVKLTITYLVDKICLN